MLNIKDGVAQFGAAYIRVSTDDQVELSPESQLEEIRKYAQREGILLLEDQIYMDAGISGKKAERRPEFMRMIATAKSSECPFSVILLWKYSRFARNQEESIFYKSILRSKCNIDVVSVTEPLIAGPFGSLIERIIEWMDEFYSIRLSQEVKRSMTVNAQRGIYQSSPPFGYQLEGGDKRGSLRPKDGEADYVRRIFESFIAGKGTYVIAKELNSLGVRTHRGNQFDIKGIEYIIRNPVYIGKVRWNPAGKTHLDFFNENIITSEGSHQRIIDDDTWNAAQQRMDEIKSRRNYKARPASELKRWVSGLVHCSACGATLVFTKPNAYRCNYYCRGKCNHSQHVRADLLENAVLSRLKKDAEGSFDLPCDVIYTNSSSGQKLVRAKATLKTLATKKVRLQEAYLAGVIDLDDFSTAKRKIESDIASAEKEISLLEAESDETATIAALRNAISLAVSTLESPVASVEEKHNSALSVIDNCVFDKKSYTLSITYRLIL